jgi:tripartite-type tricarboxylate transporter receptor subunit TctC
VRAPPDGYTLLQVGTSHAVNTTLFKLDFDLIRDIAPVAGIARTHLVMLVHPSFPARTVPEFIAYARANPGKINMASAGSGSSPRLAGELFKLMTGVDMVHVPYRGGAPAMSDLIAGPGAGDVQQPSRGRVHQGGQAARARGDHGHTLGRASGSPDHRRVRAGL